MENIRYNTIIIKRIFLLLLLLGGVSFAQNTVYIVKGGPDTGSFSGGVFVGFGGKVNHATHYSHIITSNQPGRAESSWNNVTGITQSGTTLTKTASSGWGNAGAASNSVLDTLQNGWVQCKIDNLQDVYAFGLSTADTDAGYTSIQYAIMINGGQLYVYNSGQLVGSYGTATLNDSIRIEKIADVLYYTKNNVALFNQQIDAYRPLITDMALYTQGMVLAVSASFATPQTGTFYRSRQTGNWSSASTWQVSTNNTTWSNATQAPNYTNVSTITIQSGHTVTLNTAVTVDELVINGTLVYPNNAGVALTINNGTGTDLTINGTFRDERTTAITWIANATWSMGTTGTLIRTTNTSASNWNTRYEGGISNIPATANWIIRKTGANNPPLTATAGMHYPNLIIENNTSGTWVTAVSSSITGSAAPPVIKGDLNVGGNGTGNVSFLNSNTNAAPVFVGGNVTVKTGSALRSQGTGFEVQGNLVLNGTVNYANSNAAFVFTGSQNQTISATGTISFINLQLNKLTTAATVTLLNPATVSGTALFTNGYLNTTTTNVLTFTNSSTVTGATANSFVNGPVRKTGNSAFVFPTGKAGNYQPIAISAPASAAATYIAEYFHQNAGLGTNKDVTIDSVSNCEYWTLNNVGTAYPVRVTLGWNNQSCRVTTVQDGMRLTRWNGTRWVDLGNNSTITGTVTSTTTVNTFGTFTLAQALPVINFTMSTSTVYVGDVVTFTNTSQRFSSTTAFAWSYGDVCYMDTSAIGTVFGFPCIDSTVGIVPVTHRYYEPGTYTITLSAKDLGGNMYSISKTITIITIAATTCSSGNNCELVCNGNLEQFNSCNNNNLSLYTYTVSYWTNVAASGGGIASTPDYWLNNPNCPYNPLYSNDKVPNNYLGCQADHSGGNAYVGIYTYEGTAPNVREYVTSTLSTPMVTGQYYKVSYWVSLGDICKYASYAPRAYFTNSPPTINNNGTAIVAANNRLTNTDSYGIITDKANWVNITGIYQSISNETQITLGNFSYDAYTPLSVLTPNICSSTALHNTNDRNGAYYYIDDISVTPLNNPITITATQTTICAGQSIILHATGGNGYYNWAAGNQTFPQHGATITVSPAITTTYTISSYNPVYGCSLSQSITINVNPLPYVVTGAAATTICAGQSTQLVALGGAFNSYSWQPSATLNNPSVYAPVATPTMTTTYSVSVTDNNGCSNTAQVQIVVTPNPNFIVFGNNISCGNSIYYATPFQQGVTYSWSTSTGLQGTGSFANLTYANFNGGTITFTGTNATGCTHSASLYVSPCCTAPPSNPIPTLTNSTANALNAYGTTSGNTLTLTGRELYINGTFIVNRNLTLRGCIVRLGYMAKITVNPGYTLTITNNGRNDKSHLYACSDMWDGIYLPQANSTLVINNGSTIEDAINAVVSDNRGKFTISSTTDYGNVIFNKNYKSIVARNASSGNHPGTVSSTTIQCYDGVTGGNPTNTNNKLHYPYNTIRSATGIDISNTSGITIGNPSNIDFKNTFTNLDNGIIVYNASVAVYNNTFLGITYMGNATGECFKGIAICASASNGNRTLTVGSSNTNTTYRNYFQNCYRGIGITGYTNANIRNNTFMGIPNTAIRATKVYNGRTITASNNIISYAHIGIDCYDNKGTTVNIGSNNIDGGIYDATAQGIRTQEISSAISNPATTYTITGNIISNVQYGVNASGLNAGKINTNTINNIKNIQAVDYGIILNNSTNCQVIGNVANGQNGNDYWVCGIRIELSTNNRVQCNEVNNIGSGLFFGGAQGPSTVIAKNLMNNNYRALVLNYAVVGQQGSPGNPTDNRWTNISSNQYHTFSYFSIGQSSPFYVRNAYGVYRPINYQAYAFPISNYTIPLNATLGQSFLQCPAVSTGGSGIQLLATSALQIAEDSITPVAYQASTRSMLRQSLYSYLQTDNSLTYSYPQIAQFRNYHDQHTIGKMDRAEQVINNTQNQTPALLQWAKMLNNSAALTSLADTNSQWMNNLLIDNALAGGVDFTNTELNDLRALAVKCPYQDGRAVLQARTILSQYDTTLYMNDCEIALPPAEERSITIAETEETSNSINNVFRLYPNPNNGNMLLDYVLTTNENGELKIFDITGKLISTYLLDNTKQQLSIDNRELENGIYNYQISINGRIVKSDKLIIIK